MDAQTQILPYFRLLKRLESVQHIKNKPYFRPGIESEPDPFDETCSTRMWRFKMKIWVETLKTIEFGSCRYKSIRDPAPDVIAGPQSQ